MNVEEFKGYKIVCQHIFPIEEIKVNSNWISSSGSIVTITSIVDDWIYYKQVDCGIVYKDSFSFQCRYCLIIE